MQRYLNWFGVQFERKQERSASESETLSILILLMSGSLILEVLISLSKAFCFASVKQTLKLKFRTSEIYKISLFNNKLIDGYMIILFGRMLIDILNNTLNYLIFSYI